MASGHKPQVNGHLTKDHPKVNGHLTNDHPQMNGHLTNGHTSANQQSQDVEMSGPSSSMMGDKLKARLYFKAPLQTSFNPPSLRFKGVTQNQAKRMTAPIGPRIEPLVNTMDIIIL